MKLFPHNPVYVFCMILLPWRFGKTYILVENQTISFSRYFCFDEKTLKRDVISLCINDIQEIGFSKDFGVTLEKTIVGIYGTYKSQEIILKSNETFLAFNARPYTKSQVRTVIKIILEQNQELSCSNNLKRALNIC